MTDFFTDTVPLLIAIIIFTLAMLIGIFFRYPTPKEGTEKLGFINKLSRGDTNLGKPYYLLYIIVCITISFVLAKIFYMK